MQVQHVGPGNNPGVLATSGAETGTFAQSIPPLLWPLPLPCWPASIHQMFLELSSVLANGDREAGGRMSAHKKLTAPSQSPQQPESPTARGARKVCRLTGEGVVYFAQGKTPCDTGGLARGGGKHTNCTLFPLW